MKEIIFFSKNLKIGGMEKALVSLLNKLKDYYKVTLVLEEKSGALLNLLDPSITIKEYKLSTSSNKIIRKVSNLFKRFFWSISNRNKYDFSCNYATYSVIGSKLCQISSKNCAYYIHSNYYQMFNGDCAEVKKFFAPHRIEKFKKIICVSNESCNGLEKVFPDLKGKLQVINNLVDADWIKQQALKNIDYDFNKEKINFIFLGRLENESKNIDLLIESFSKALKKNKRIQLNIVGNGPYKDSLLSLIKENNIEDNVTFLGEQNNPYPLLRNSDCLILTSNYEGFPVIFSEALVLNIPIMSTIMVSDGEVDMKEYSIELKHESNDIGEKILSFKKMSKKYDVDFETINVQRIEKLRDIIEVR